MLGNLGNCHKFMIYTSAQLDETLWDFYGGYTSLVSRSPMIPFQHYLRLNMSNRKQFTNSEATILKNLFEGFTTQQVGSCMEFKATFQRLLLLPLLYV